MVNDLSRDSDKAAEQVFEEIVIPAENAVFWLDENGIWHNESGRFRKKKIIDLFNASIRKDELGYHVTQIKGKRREKVYFPFDDVVLFAVDFFIGKTITLILNTGEKCRLNPQNLLIQNDCLYMDNGEERIKFSERCLLKISKFIEYEGNQCFVRIYDTRHPVQNLDGS